MKKIFIPTFLILGLLFLVITYFKYAPSSTSDASDTGEGKQKSTEVIEFWNHYDRATDLRTAGEFQQATARYREALKIDSTHSNALYYMGNMQMVLGDYADAEKYWNRLIRLNPASARAHIQLGTLYSCSEELNKQLYHPPKAFAHFKKAMEINPEDTGPMLQMAKMDLVNNRLKEARQKLADVVSSNFRSTEGIFLQGYLAWKDKGADEATTYLEKAAAIVKGDDERYANAGEGETSGGDDPLAMAALRCNLYSDLIKNLITAHLEGRLSGTEQVYRSFDREIASSS